MDKPLAPTLKVHDLAFARLSAPDLHRAEEFLVDFGMVRVERTPDALYMRGTDPTHHIQVVERGEPRVRSIAFTLPSEDALRAAAKLPGASTIETIDEPGGGRRVRLRDPAGFELELIHGMEALPPIPVPEIRVNTGLERTRRAGVPCRPPKGASQVKRMAHFVLVTPKVVEVSDWYEKTLGMLLSDSIYLEQESHTILTFYRLDRGDEYVDHHAVNIADGGDQGINHFAFEVRDFDDLMIGHEHLQKKGYVPMRGPGRHFVGSQIFDYWLSPTKCMHEHITDTDVLNARSKPGLIRAGTTDSFWGESNSPTFREQISH